MTAMTAATLDVLSGGRFRLGLGVSGPQVSEGWHGVRFDRAAGPDAGVRRDRPRRPGRWLVAHEGRHFPLPLPDGPGKALKLTLRPTRDDLPVYLAAVGPKNLQLAGEIADGWLAVFLAPSYAGEQLAEVAAGRAKAGRTDEGFDVVATVPIVVDPDPQRAAEPVRRYAALYVGGMGSRDQNFYNALAVRMGYAEEAATVQDLFLGGRPRDAAAAVPFALIDDTSLLGDRDRIAAGLTRFAEAGVTTLALSPFGPLEATPRPSPWPPTPSTPSPDPPCPVGRPHPRLPLGAGVSKDADPSPHPVTASGSAPR